MMRKGYFDFINRQSAKRVTTPEYVGNTVDGFFEWLEENYGDTDYIAGMPVAMWTKTALQIRLTEYLNFLEEEQLRRARELDDILTQDS